MIRRLGSRTPAGAALLCLLGCLLAASSPAAPVPLAPVDLSAAGQNAAVPQVVIDPAGSAVTVWVRSNGAHDIVQAASRQAGGAWSAPADLSAAGRDAAEPQVAIDGAGNAVAVWSRSDGAHTVVQCATRPAGGAWSAPAGLSDPERNAKAPQVALDAGGNAVAVWSRYDGTHYIVQSAARPASGAWSGAVNVSVAGRDANEPQVAIDPAGNAVAVWSRYDGADYIVQSAVRSPGGSWASPPLDLSATGESAEAPQVATGPTGEAVAVWSRAAGAGDVVQSAARPVGGAWSGAVDLSTNTHDAAEPQLAIGPAGEAVAVWSRSDIGFNTVVQASVRALGSAWSPALDISASGEIDEDPAVAVDPSGNAVAVWSSSDASPTVIQSATRPPGGAWSGPGRLSELGRSAKEPQVAFDPEGDGVAVWSRDNGTHTIIQALGLDGAGPQLRGLAIPAAATMGLPVSFSVSPFDAWSAIGSIRWGFGDEEIADGGTVTHVYPRPGTYRVTLAVADALGRVSEAGGTVTVFPKARAVRNIRVKGRLAQLKVHCPSPAGCEGLAKLVATLQVERGDGLVKKRLTIGKAGFSVLGSATKTVPIRLKVVALAAVREAGKHGLKAQLTGPGIKHRVVALYSSR